MERKYQLRINKPIDPFFNEENIFQTPIKKDSEDSTIKNCYLTEIETVTITSEVKDAHQKENVIFKSYFYKIIAASLFILLLCSYFFPSKSMNKIVEVIKEVPSIPEDYHKIKDELLTLKNTPKNLCSLENECKILYQETSPSYKYGLFSTKCTDPNLLLSDSNKCFSFDGSSGKITFMFPKQIKVVKVGIFHPKTKNTSSAVKDFKLNGINFTFSNDVLEYFDCELIDDKFTLEIISNHGRKEFTSVYRVFLIGTVL